MELKLGNRSSTVLIDGFLTLFYAEGAYMPPYHISAIFSGRTYPRRLQVYSKFKFCNYRTHKIGLGVKKISTVRGNLAKSAGYVESQF